MPNSIATGKTGYQILPGLNRIHGFLVEAADIILFGEHDPTRPDVELDALVVTLRNAFEVDASSSGTLGCTIDPRPGDDPFRIQTVGVFGMKHSCLTAARFVSLDYELKRAGSGVASGDGKKILPSAMDVSDPIAACGQVVVST